MQLQALRTYVGLLPRMRLLALQWLLACSVNLATVRSGQLTLHVIASSAMLALACAALAWHAGLTQLLAHEIRQPLHDASGALQAAGQALRLSQGAAQAQQVGQVVQRLGRAEAVLGAVRSVLDNNPGRRHPAQPQRALVGAGRRPGSR